LSIHQELIFQHSHFSAIDDPSKIDCLRLDLDALVVCEVTVEYCNI